MLGEKQAPIAHATVPPTVILLVGLQGSGKTTTAGKLARRLKTEQKAPFLVAADVYRPAAIEQLQTLGRQIDVGVHGDTGSKDVVKIVRDGHRRRGQGPGAHGPGGHRGPAPDRRRDDGRAGQAQGRDQAARDPAGRRRHDRPGRGPDRQGLPRRPRHHRRDPDQDGRRRAGRRGALDLRRHPRADQVHRRGREARRAGAVPSRPAGGADPAAGRHPLAGGEGAGRGRREGSRAAGAEGHLEEGTRPRGLPQRHAADAEDGSAEERAGHAARASTRRCSRPRRWTTRR